MSAVPVGSLAVRSPTSYSKNMQLHREPTFPLQVGLFFFGGRGQTTTQENPETAKDLWLQRAAAEPQQDRIFNGRN